ncbi:MAG: glycosyltransferase family 4 protein [Bacteroidetes bacterium]|nr:glycosyltransferase family 4 protein [Bacteroidota bacterium]MBU1580984.1 glycosyltransferase family 4 protein [Bacteroidota bacterium]
MKILQYPSYVNIPAIKEFSGRSTGYGKMIFDIASSIATSGIETDLITNGNITKGHTYKRIRFLRRNWWDILSNIRVSNFLNAVKAVWKDKVSLNKVPHYMLYHISMGYFESVLLENQYDLVHIHGFGPGTLPIISICKKWNLKYLVTLHGLNSFSESVKVSEKHRKLEKDFLKQVHQQKIPVTVISTGIRNTILNYLNVTESDTFFVVPNGCNTKINTKRENINVRKKYNIPENKKIAVCVGNIVEHKNQVQVVRAFTLLPSNVRNNLVILFLGRDVTNGVFEQEILKSGQKENLIACGNIPKEEVHIYYQQSDFNIVASIIEGFGLSMIEGFTQGIPTLTFSNLDAIPDLYHESAMLLVNERSDEALANGIENILKIRWDKKLIQEYAQNYSLEKMSSKYISIYDKIINDKF